MAEVKWIKISTGIFDDEKILLLENLPEGDSIITIWLKLLILAGKQNNDGVFILNDKIAYTDEMLASIFRRKVEIVKFALKAFEQYGMIEIIEGVITIPNWNKYQSLDAYEKKKERDRLYQEKRRAEQRKLLASNNRLMSDDLSDDCSSLVAVSEEEEDIDLSISKDIDKDKYKTASSLACPYQEIIDLFNNTCVSLPKIKVANAKRKQAIKSRWIELKQDLNQFKELFEKVEQTEFLKGHNDRNWMASFDWLLKPDNMIKVLEGNYDKRGGQRNEHSRKTGILPKPEKGSFIECRNLV